MVVGALPEDAFAPSLPLPLPEGSPATETGPAVDASSPRRFMRNAISRSEPRYLCRAAAASAAPPPVFNAGPPVPPVLSLPSLPVIDRARAALIAL